MIRDATGADRATILRFWRSLQEFELSMEPNRNRAESAAEEHLDALEDWIKISKAGGSLLAEVEGRALGWLAFGTENREGAYLPEETREVGWISEIWVEEEGRGRGIASALIAEAEQRIAAKGINRVELAAIVDNDRAIKLYRHLGFRDYELTLGKTL